MGIDAAGVAVSAARKLDERPALTVAEVAQRLGVHAKTIRREIKRGRLEAFRVGDSVRVSWDAIEKYKRETSVVPTATNGGASGGRTHPAPIVRRLDGNATLGVPLDRRVGPVAIESARKNVV